MAQEMRTAAPAPVVADPGPLGLAAFALTTFVLSAHNANLFGFGDHGNAIVIGLAIFYGGLAQFLAGNDDFWMALGTSLAFALFGKLKAGDVQVSLVWFLLAFFIFNTYMMLAATRINTAVFGVFLTLEVTEALLALGFFAGKIGS